MDRSATMLLQITLCLTVLVVQTYSNISWAREVLYRTKRQAECQDDKFRCTSREFIDKFDVCDGTKDCADGSDESETACRELNINPPQKGRCLLPQPPEYGTYTAPVCVLDNRTSACSQVPGAPVPEYWTLSFNCNEGYYIKETQNENFIVFCVRGTWSTKIPVCRKMCSPLVSLSVGVKCFNGKYDVDCSKPMPPGTRAEGECKPFYTQIRPPQYTEIVCKENGQWSYELFDCAPVCRMRNTKSVNNPLIVDHFVAKYGDLPWHVGLYERNNSNQWEQKCGGTLISPHLVLTAAHCVFSEGIKRTLPSEAIKVGLGKNYREWTHDEPNAVKADVRKILIPPRYNGEATSYARDIALLDLTHSVQLHGSIMPACIDWDREFTITPGMLGTWAGWGRTENGTRGEVLLYAHLPYLDYRQCLYDVPKVYWHYITSDKFCAGFSNGTGPTSGDGGGSLTFVQDNLHYVYGICSTEVEPGNSLATFTNVGDVEVLNWLYNSRRILDAEHSEKETEFICTSGQCIDKLSVCDGREDCAVCADGSDETASQCSSVSPTSSPQKGGCLLPPPPENGSYTGAIPASENRRSACRQVPGTPVRENWILSFVCNEGYYFKETQNENFIAFCGSGKWYPKIPVCRKMCSPLVSLSAAVRCFNAGGDIDCTKSMRPGTRATGECKPSYTQTRPFSYTEIICLGNGQWSDALFYCQPVCGKRNKQGVNILPLLLHGSATKYGEFPWHVGLYLINDSKQWEQKCGGTLISPHIVLTAAHCVFSEAARTKLPPETLKVGLGKYYREFTCDEPYAVQANVREISIPPRYYGRASSFAYDIALLDLTHSVQVNESIMPACVDWKYQFTITNGTLGTLAGWGTTENGTPSDVLLYANLPIVDHYSCILKVPQAFVHYVTTDKFCAGYTNGTGAALGDSGGGLTFVHDDLHYVYGIVSTKVLNETSFITFTNVSNLELFNWITSVTQSFDLEHSET